MMGGGEATAHHSDFTDWETPKPGPVTAKDWEMHKKLSIESKTKTNFGR